MKKVLFTANLDSFFIKFLIPQLKKFKDMGYVVHVASKNQNIIIPFCDMKYDINFSRSFNLKDNIVAYKKIKKIIEDNNYELISCHTPFGAAIPRLACKSMKKKRPKIIYTAHGFHFYKGAPVKNWVIYYSMEKYLSKYTDSIITINEEDYNLVKKRMNCKAYYIPGIGIDKNKFNIELTEKDKKKLYDELKLNNDNFIMIFPGEINKNKNQKLLLDTMKILKCNINSSVLLLPGNDLTNGKMEKYAKKIGVYDSVRFLGYRKDIPKLLKISNLSVSSSKREGLPINIVEALYDGLPVVATDCRGNRDLIENGKNGFLVKNNSAKEFAEKIYQIYNDRKLYDKMSKLNKKKANNYLVDNVINKIMNIYIK